MTVYAASFWRFRPAARAKSADDLYTAIEQHEG